MKRLSAIGLLSFLFTAGISALSLALTAAPAQAACTPAISAITPVNSGYTGSGRIQISGSCFGTATGFNQEDRAYFRLSDLAPGASLTSSRWNACWTGDPGTDTITCSVSEWSDSRIVFDGFNGAFDAGGYHFNSGDRLAVQVWNAQSLAGPAVQLVPIATGPATPIGPTGVQPHSTPAQTRVHNDKLGGIARTLASPRNAFSNVSSDVVNASIAVAAALFITFPANLFNQTFEENYADIRAWWRRRFGWLRLRSATNLATTETGKAEPLVQWRSFAAVVLGGALLGGLLDPHFGANARSVISVLALVAAICAGIAIPTVVAELFHRRHHDATQLRIRALPAGLIIAGVCVLLSRMTGFEPGYLYGIVAGVAFGRALAKREQAHLIIWTTLAVVGVSVVAWIAWAAINGTAEESGASGALIWLDDALAAIFVAGLVGSVISMLPLRFLPGRVLQSWNRAAWAGVFAITLFGLIQVMLRPHATAEGPSHSPLVTTILLFVGFAAATFAFRWHFVRKRQRESGEAPEPWRQTMRHLLGEAAAGPVQLAATTDGVSFIDLTEGEKVVDLTHAEAQHTGPEPAPAVPAQRKPVPAKKATPRSRTTKTQ